VATINATVFQRMTFFIVTKLRKLGDLYRFAGRCFIGSTDSGWMTKAVWTTYCFLYISEVIRHFLTLGIGVTRRGQPLLSDEHGSRLNFRAVRLAKRFGMDLLMFLPHFTRGSRSTS
jgi:hypothetical protein